MTRNVASLETVLVRRRHVIYVPGYDPFPARRYRELYRKEGAKQAALSGYCLEVKGAEGGPNRFSWDVASEVEGEAVHTRFDLMVWDDIVKRSMAGSIAGTYWEMLRTAALYFRSGAILRLVRMRKGPVIAAFYPVIFMFLQLGVALMLAWAAGSLLGTVVHPLAAWLGVLVVPLVLIWFRRKDSWFLSYYLLHNYAFSAREGGRMPRELEPRIDQFAAHLAEALQEPVDEVLVVGHSSGAHLAIAVIARVLEEQDRQDGGPILSLLTLGQVIPMVSFLPGAADLRHDLTLLSESDKLTWIDVTAPGDGCAFALCDPVSVSGSARSGKRWPLVLSAAFTRSLRPETWAGLRWRFFRLHFQYLCAFDALKGRPDEYDYFRITAGPKTLQARLGARKPSPARIAKDVAGFSSEVYSGTQAVA